MLRFTHVPTLLAGLLACLGLGWTTGESPMAVSTAVRADTDTACASEACQLEASGFRSHWISRTGSGNLFLVVHNDCAHHNPGCVARFVERTASGTATRLDLQGDFRVVRSGKSVPDVETRRDVSESETEVTRYTWLGGAYVLSETRQLYRVNGELCGTALECYQKAQAAHAGQETGKALRILETVHRLSYI